MKCPLCFAGMSNPVADGICWDCSHAIRAPGWLSRASWLERLAVRFGGWLCR